MRIGCKLLVFMAVSTVAYGLAPATRMALATATEPTSMGGANLISYADSDFESWPDNWVADSDASLGQDGNHAYLHDASLKDNVGGTDSKFQLGSTPLISIPSSPNMSYRVGAYFLAPTSGGSITWALGAYGSTGNWLGWTSGNAVTLTDSGTWQYASAVIDLPAGTVSVVGPRVSYSGGSKGQTLNMDEVQLNSDRAATLIGADGGSDGAAAAWATANNTVNGTSGLNFQTDKIFYDPMSTATKPNLPSQFSGSTCASATLANLDVACVITYKPIQTNGVQNLAQIDPIVKSFTKSAAASGRTIIMVYYNEPENPDNTFTYKVGTKTYTGAEAYRLEYEHEAKVIRAAAGDAPNVFTATTSYADYYQTVSGKSPSCSYIIPPHYTDFYLIDAYQGTPTGGDLAAEGSDEWNNWLSCVSGYNKPIGLAEYGLGKCGTSGAREDSMMADDTYLESLWGSSTVNAPVIMWEYWWANDDKKAACKDWKFINSATIGEWQRIETGP